MLRREFWQRMLGLIGLGGIKKNAPQKIHLELAQEYDDIVTRDLVIIENLKKELTRKDDCVREALLSLDKWWIKTYDVEVAVMKLCGALDGHTNGFIFADREGTIISLNKNGMRQINVGDLVPKGWDWLEKPEEYLAKWIKGGLV